MQLLNSRDATGIGRWAYRASTQSGEDYVTAPQDRVVDLLLPVDGTIFEAPARAKLAEKGWNVSQTTSLSLQPRPRSMALVIDDGSTLAHENLDEIRWAALQKLFSERNPILWVTTGSQLRSNDPHNALIYGFARTMRSEDPSLRLAVLDVESVTHDTSIEAIHTILQYLQRPPSQAEKDLEFAESDGIIHVNRILPSPSLNKAEVASILGADGQELTLCESQSCVRLVCQRQGALDALRFEEVPRTEVTLEDDFVEVDIKAAGLNFKVSNMPFTRQSFLVWVPDSNCT